jgi:uncharacterized protein GlcG (DUF336 family)
VDNLDLEALTKDWKVMLYAHPSFFFPFDLHHFSTGCGGVYIGKGEILSFIGISGSSGW